MKVTVTDPVGVAAGAVLALIIGNFLAGFVGAAGRDLGRYVARRLRLRGWR